MNISKRKNIILTCFLLLAFCLTAFSGLFVNNNKNAYAETPDGIQAAVNENSITMYYLTLPTKDLIFRTTSPQLAGIVVPWLSPTWNVFEDMSICTNNRVHTFIFTYKNITVNGSALLTTWNIECSSYGMGNLFGGYHDFYPKEDININIRSEYYELFQNADFSNVTVTYMYGGNGYKMISPDNSSQYEYNLTGASLHTRQVSADYDPIEEEGQAPDNGGIAVDPEDIDKPILELPSLDLDFGNLFFYIAVIFGIVVIIKVYFKNKR